MELVKIKERIVDNISWLLNKNPQDIAEETRLIDLGMDSLDNVELLMNIENEFEISVHDDEAKKLVTVSDCIKLVERYAS